MIYPFDPAWRGLVHPPGRGLWTFPDDYPLRVGAAVHEIAPRLRRTEDRDESVTTPTSEVRRVAGRLSSPARSPMQLGATP